MGHATDAILAYGYDLGPSYVPSVDHCDGWKVREVDQYGGLTVPWWSDDSDFDFLQAATAQLDAAGANEVKIETHCADRAPSYLLVLGVTVAHRGEPIQLGLADRLRWLYRSNWDDKLAAALRALGLTPLQSHPTWILASYDEAC